MLWDEGAVFSLAALLSSPHYAVLMPTLSCLAALCHENKAVAQSVASARLLILNYSNTYFKCRLLLYPACTFTVLEANQFQIY